MNYIMSSLEEYKEQDTSYESGKIFSSMCSKPLKEAVEAYQMFIETNALDSEIFPSVQRLEEEVIEIIGKLFSNPEAGGYITSGGTEGNIFSLWLARKVKEGNKVIAPRSVHYSIDKACDLQKLELVHTNLDDRYKAEVEDIKENLDRKTLAIVATAGTSALGKVDPIPAIAEIASDANCFLHIDGSFGGFLLPFVKDPPNWNFEIDHVSSISADPHKMGLAPIPTGAMLVQEEKWLELLERDISCLSEKSFTLLGSRPGGSIAAIWAALKSLGVQGYQNIAKKCMKLTAQLVKGIQRIDGLKLITEPELNLVAFRSISTNTSKIKTLLRERGWLVGLNDWPKSIRTIIMPHHSEKHVNSFLSDLKACMGEMA